MYQKSTRTCLVFPRTPESRFHRAPGAHEDAVHFPPETAKRSQHHEESVRGRAKAITKQKRVKKRTANDQNVYRDKRIGSFKFFGSCRASRDNTPYNVRVAGAGSQSVLRFYLAAVHIC